MHYPRATKSHPVAEDGRPDAIRCGKTVSRQKRQKLHREDSPSDETFTVVPLLPFPLSPADVTSWSQA